MGLVALLMTPPPASRAPPQRSWGGEIDEQHLPTGAQSEHRPDAGGPDRRARPSAGDRQREGRLGQVDDGACTSPSRCWARARASPRSTSMRARARSAATSRTAPPMPGARASTCRCRCMRLCRCRPCRTALPPKPTKGRASKRRLEAVIGAVDFVIVDTPGSDTLPVAARPYLGRHAADAAQRQLHRSRPSGARRSRHAQDRAAVDLCRGGVEAAPAPRHPGRPAGRLGGDAQSPVFAGGAQQARHGHGHRGAGPAHRLSHRPRA